MKTNLFIIAALATGVALTAAIAPRSFAGAGSGKESAGGPDGAKLWAQTCTRCHNTRPATSFSDAQWVVITHHMRIRANLTGPETRAILAFLKEGN